MCDERERLLGYLFDECEPAERREVEAHLGECHVCRAEIAGLRRVRQDLLAWDVPDHEPIWRPMPAPRPTSAWGANSVWTLATAASLVFVAGLAGGVATRYAWPAREVTTAASAAQGAAAAPAVATASDLAALEQRVLERVRTEMAEVRMATSREPVSAVPVSASTNGAIDSIRRQLADIERWRSDQIGLNVELDRKLNRLSSRTSTLDTQAQVAWEVARMNTLRVNNAVGADSVR